MKEAKKYGGRTVDYLRGYYGCSPGPGNLVSVRIEVLHDLIEAARKLEALEAALYDLRKTFSTGQDDYGVAILDRLRGKAGVI